VTPDSSFQFKPDWVLTFPARLKPSVKSPHLCSRRSAKPAKSEHALRVPALESATKSALMVGCGYSTCLQHALNKYHFILIEFIGDRDRHDLIIERETGRLIGSTCGPLWPMKSASTGNGYSISPDIRKASIVKAFETELFDSHSSRGLAAARILTSSDTFSMAVNSRDARMTASTF
jgi:hypothetical protein